MTNEYMLACHLQREHEKWDKCYYCGMAQPESDLVPCDNIDNTGRVVVVKCCRSLDACLERCGK